ncbi:unnamed protein product [Prorocentrum cordatum]|uniref:Deacetylase sirtuin-type domain-containing protein n=1 Tax=Prorocentrum cordatum TaxID=2364126 RepID=A0ABN9XF25_9DINO|nr:unnamed protein product [Polarella glacialis]
MEGIDEGIRLRILQSLLRAGGRFSFDMSSNSGSETDDEEGDSPLETADLEGLAQYIERNDPKNIICMVGAGLSTSAGIPDFRSPGTGLYDNLQRYNLPRPEAVFDLDFFRESPDAFYDLARELWPTGEKYAPTLSHHFLRLLERQGRLRRCYTQNIDMLEQLAGLSEEKVIAAHGNFAKAHSIEGREVPVQELKEAVFEGVDACRALERKYGSLVKPDIVFFGEGLPDRFFSCRQQDFPKCDLLLVIGTSLAVQPFNQLISAVPRSCPRVLVNREAAGLSGDVPGGFRFGREGARDVFLQGDCDERVRALCRRLGWLGALQELVPPRVADATPALGAEDCCMPAAKAKAFVEGVELDREAARDPDRSPSAGSRVPARSRPRSRSRSRQRRRSPRRCSRPQERGRRRRRTRSGSFASLARRRRRGCSRRRRRRLPEQSDRRHRSRQRRRDSRERPRGDLRRASSPASRGPRRRTRRSSARSPSE